MIEQQQCLMSLLYQLYVSTGENNIHICTRQELQSAEFLSKLFLLFIHSFSAGSALTLAGYVVGKMSSIHLMPGQLNETWAERCCQWLSHYTLFNLTYFYCVRKKTPRAFRAMTSQNICCEGLFTFAHTDQIQFLFHGPAWICWGIKQKMAVGSDLLCHVKWCARKSSFSVKIKVQ